MRRTPIVAAGVLAALLLVLSPRAAAAQAAFLVEDILPGASSSVASVFAELDGITLFGATDPTNGRELWRSDGTPGGTALLQDLDPGVGSSAPSYFVAAQSDLLFTVSLPSTGNELWFLKADPRDFGAAPTSYGTLLANDGVRHSIVTGFHLGAALDFDADGQPDSGASLDDIDHPIDDEDGVVFTSLLESAALRGCQRPAGRHSRRRHGRPDVRSVPRLVGRRARTRRGRRR